MNGGGGGGGGYSFNVLDLVEKVNMKKGGGGGGGGGGYSLHCPSIEKE